jgi:hypothetical protein
MEEQKQKLETMHTKSLLFWMDELVDRMDHRLK